MSGAPNATSRRISRVAALRAACLLLLVSVLVAWIRTIVAGQESLSGKDWVWLHRVGSLWWSDGLAQVYSGSLDGSQPFVHPPYFIWFCVPLGLLEVGWPAFAVFTLGSAALCAAAVSLLVASLSERPGQRLTAVLAVLASGSWVGCMVTGQVAALQLLSIAGGLAAWRRNRPVLAGLLLSVLAIKPQLVLPLLVLAASAREWRMVQGLCAGIAVLVASTVPLGLGLWRDYLVSMSFVGNLLAAGSPVLWKQRTLLASLSWIGGRPAGAAGVLGIWLVLVLPLSLGVLRVWWRASRDQLPRLIGIAVLFLVAASPYLFFYDGLLLAVPGIVWWLQRERYASRGRHRVCGALLGTIYAWEYVNLAVLGAGLPPIVGLLVACWLLVEVRDFLQGQRAPPALAA